MTMQQKSVLIVDDDKFLVRLYEKKFVADGWSATTALSAGEALQKLRDGLLPSVIMFDLIMPGIDGAHFLASLRTEKLAPRAALVALTNQSEPESVERIKALGVDGYIVKASSIPSEVVAIVRTFAEKK